MIVYLDTSAALKLVVEGAGSAALAAWLDALAPEDDLVASYLLHTEMFCAAARRGELDPSSVRQVLAGVELFDVLRDDLLRAATSGWRLRSADAIHLATAIRIQADVLVTFDSELRDAALRAGLGVMPESN